MRSFEHETDVATLREALRLLALENERLTKLNVELQKALAEAKGERVEQLELEIAQLQQTVAARNQALFGDSSERRPSGKPQAKEPPKQTGHGPRKQDLPVVERVHELDVADRTCSSCGGELSEWIGQFEERREVEMVERRFVELVHKRKKYRCKCGGCIETAPAPPKLMPGGRYSIDIAISIAVGKYGDHMPLERMASALGRQGLVIDSQTLWDQINALARILSPVHDALQATVLMQPVIGADETHWKLLGHKSAGGKTKRWQVWAITSEGAVCYRIKAGRSVEEAADVLGDFRGIVMCDGYAVYSSLHKKRPAMRLANCWAHVRRKFVEVEDVEPGRCTEVLDLIGKLFEVEQRARDGDLDDAALLALRAAESGPLVDAIHAWALAQRALPSSPLGKAIAYMGSLWKGVSGILCSGRWFLTARRNHYADNRERSIPRFDRGEVSKEEEPSRRAAR